MPTSLLPVHSLAASWRRRAIALAVLLPTLVLGPLAAPSLAQGRHGLVDRNFYEESFDSGVEEPDPFFEEQCGVRVRYAGDITVVESVFRDGTLVLRINEKRRWYDFDTGELLIAQKDREILTEKPVSEAVDEEAGTRTVVLEVDYVGVPLRLMKPHDGVVLMSAGLLERTITLEFDLETGELLSEDVQVTRVAGPHPYLGPSGNLELGELLIFVCQQLTA